MGEHPDLVQGPRPVRVAAGVTDVDQVLVREQVDDGPGDGEPAEAGVEHADGPVHRHSLRTDHLAVAA